jgi:hypothetical protein
LVLTGILFAFGRVSRGFESDCMHERVEVIDDALVEAVELRLALASR